MSAGQPVIYVRDGDHPPLSELSDLVGVGSGASEAIRLAVEQPDLVGQLVLVSARGDLAGAAEIRCLTLIVQGSEDESETGRALKKRIPSSYLCYVYDAARDVEADQPERLASLVNEFLERGEAFIINWKENPNHGS